MKPTPGPWKVEIGGFVGGPVGFGRVCQLWNKHEEDFSNAKANARLIAAAPDLLAELKRFKQDVNGMLYAFELSLRQAIGDMNIAVLEAKVAAAEVVIAKAGGVR